MTSLEAIPQIKRRDYRQAVLSGALRGQQLRRPLRQGLDAVAEAKSLEGILLMNKVLLWHLAHAPFAEDRAMVMEVADLYAEALPHLQEAFYQALDETGATLLPYSPAIHQSSLYVDPWFEDIFPNAKIDWYQTYHDLKKGPSASLQNFIAGLAQAGIALQPTANYLTLEGFQTLEAELAAKKLLAGQGMVGEIGFLFSRIRSAEVHIPGLFAVLRGVVPEYPRLMFPVAELASHRPNLTRLYNALRLNMTSRNRTVHHYFDGRNKYFNLLIIPPDGVVGQTLSDSEQALAFDLPLPGQNGLLYGFIKNGWLIGYGLATPRVEKPDLFTIGFYIFDDFRGTPSSAQMLHSLMSIARQEFQARGFILERDLTGQVFTDRGLPPENQTALTAFYEANGFRWVPGRPEQDLMFRPA